MQSNIDNKGVNSEFDYKYSMDNSGVKIKGSLFKDFEKESNIRGIALEEIYDNNVSGYQVSVDYSQKLLQFRKGLWNPNIFMDNIYGSLFVDYTDIDIISDKVAYGYELSCEIGTLNRLKLVPKLGISYSGREIEPFWDFKISF